MAAIIFIVFSIVVFLEKYFSQEKIQMKYYNASDKYLKLIRE